MIDLHSHILPGIDDGAADLDMALDMARALVADGVKCVACTPHILPGVYDNDGPSIRLAVEHFRKTIDEAGIPLRLVTGADNHIVPDFVDGLRSGRLLSIADSSYVLVEPAHHVAPPRLEDLFFSILVAGHTPILTHPERLTWIEGKYEIVERLAHRGVWMQITAGSLTGNFGRRPKYWAERMICEGLVHLLATDCHDISRRPPRLGSGAEAAARLVGHREAEHMVVTRPLGILRDRRPRELPASRTAANQDEMRGTDALPQHDDGSSHRSFSERLRQFFG
jgi:protein-tyrosine phosphatase